MMERVETRLDGSTLIVRIPGRKRIFASDGNEIAPADDPQPDGTLMKVLARVALAEAAGWPSWPNQPGPLALSR